MEPEFCLIYIDYTSLYVIYCNQTKFGRGIEKNSETALLSHIMLTLARVAETNTRVLEIWHLGNNYYVYPYEELK